MCCSGRAASGAPLNTTLDVENHPVICQEAFMGNYRLPGPLCTILGALKIDAGTLCRATSPVPGSRRLQLARTNELTLPAAMTPALAKLTSADFEAAAAASGVGVEVALVRAFAEVESGGKSGFGSDGRPLIAYEGHWFRKFTDRKYDKDYPLLSYPYKTKAGPEWQKNNKDQATAWNTPAEAEKLDRVAALQSCSWGMFQVMGFNYAKCGYEDVDAFVTAMKPESAIT